MIYKMFNSIMTAILIVLCIGISHANTQGAKAALGSSTTNSICAAGYNGPNPYEQPSVEKPENAESICAGRGDVVECYRELYKQGGSNN